MQVIELESEPEPEQEVMTFVYAPSATRIIRHIADVGSAVVLGEELYVLLQDNSLRVYEAKTLELIKMCALIMIKSSFDIAACSHFNNVYVTDPVSKAILKLDQKSDKFSVMTLQQGQPLGISATKSHTMLVTMRDVGVILEIKDSTPVRVINLDVTVISPYKAIEISSGIYAVVHGLGPMSLHRICLVDIKGRVHKSYGSLAGDEIGQINTPLSITVDESCGVLYVVDGVNDRILLFTKALTYLGSLALPVGFQDLTSIRFDQPSRKLFICDSSCLIIVSVPPGTKYPSSTKSNQSIKYPSPPKSKQSITPSVASKPSVPAATQPPLVAPKSSCCMIL